MNLEALTRKLSPDELEWKVQTCGKSNGKFWAIIVPYVTARSVMARLDEAFGVLGWQVEYYFHEPINQSKDLSPGMKCKVSVYNPDLKEWISKEDGAESTDIEAYKGAISSALKRTAVCFGIGRELYEMDVTYAEIVEKGTKGARYAKTKDQEVFYWVEPSEHRKQEAPQATQQNASGFNKSSSREGVQAHGHGGSPNHDARFGVTINAPIQTINRTYQNNHKPTANPASNEGRSQRSVSLDGRGNGQTIPISQGSPARSVEPIPAAKEAGTHEGQQEQKEVTEAERKKFREIAFAKGWSNEFVIGEMKRRYNKIKLLDLDREQFYEFQELIVNNPQNKRET